MKKQESLKEVTIYTDGACSGNPGPGGYGVVLLFGKHKKELSAGYRNTTNNRMELCGVIAGLETLKEKCRVKLYTDSQYIVNAINEGWARRWQANNWKRNKKKEALNIDLWKRLMELCDKHEITFEWTKGHAGDHYNELCDQLAVNASQGENLREDNREEEFELR